MGYLMSVQEPTPVEVSAAAAASRRQLDVVSEDGLQVDGVADGEQHYRWPDGSEYYGQWQDGRPQGRGIFVWPSGDT